MDVLEKLKILGGAAKYDVCAATGCGTAGGDGFSGAIRNVVCHSFLPDGRCVSLFRVLMTNACRKDCYYCPNRVQRDIPRAAFQPEELAKLFMEFYMRNYVEGLFLSSGIPLGVASTMEDMLKTVELLRFKYRYKGYIHLKVLPGAGHDYIERAAQLVTRVSVNMEAPNQERMQRLSNTKRLKEDIFKPMDWIRQLSKGNRLPAGQTTQFVVGAAGESDSEILNTVVGLYNRVDLRRAYFSAFQPIPGTPLEEVASTPLLREHRLYQADILLRQYGFSFDDLAFQINGNLTLKHDPKMAAALRQIQQFPLEINKASYRQLLRIPGIGHLSASRIIKARKDFRINDSQELKKMGVVIKRALPFLSINGKASTAFRYIEQLSFWGEEDVDNLQIESRSTNQSRYVTTAQ